MSERPMVYLTYGDVDSPVYRSQVIGFCDFVEQELGIPVIVVAFVPARLYKQQKMALARHNRDVRVYPVVNRWQSKPWYSRYNARLVAKTGASSIMTRNPSAVELCQALQRKGWKFFYDARGCHHAELAEYSRASAEEVASVRKAEITCWKKADWVFSVSNALVMYFKDAARYRDHNHSIVPCCYLPGEHAQKDLRKSLFGEEEVTVFIYAGALSVWNFPRAFLELCRAILKRDDARLIILSKQHAVLEQYPWLLNNPKVFVTAAEAQEVPAYLEASDHAILLRKKAVTNAVASPSKFGEYLAAGCRVIISPSVGDLSSLVLERNLGIVYRGKKDDRLIESLEATSSEEKSRAKEFAQERFLRSSDMNLVKYRNLKRFHEDLVNA